MWRNHSNRDCTTHTVLTTRTWPHTIRPTFLVKEWTRWRRAGRELGAPVITRHCGLEETHTFSWPPGSAVQSSAQLQLRLDHFKAKMLRIKPDYAEGEAFDGKVLSETQKSVLALQSEHIHQTPSSVSQQKTLHWRSRPHSKPRRCSHSPHSIIYLHCLHFDYMQRYSRWSFKSLEKHEHFYSSSMH